MAHELNVSNPIRNLANKVLKNALDEIEKENWDLTDYKIELNFERYKDRVDCEAHLILK